VLWVNRERFPWGWLQEAGAGEFVTLGDGTGLTITLSEAQSQSLGFMPLGPEPGEALGDELIQAFIKGHHTRSSKSRFSSR